MGIELNEGIKGYSQENTMESDILCIDIAKKIILCEINRKSDIRKCIKDILLIRSCTTIFDVLLTMGSIGKSLSQYAFCTAYNSYYGRWI